MSPVNLSKVPEYYHKYISRVKEQDLNRAFELHRKELPAFLAALPADKWDHSYAPGKWTIKEVVQHILDGERIFGYRALCFARKEETPLPGYEENDYSANSKAGNRTPGSLMEELDQVMLSSALLFKSFDEEQLEQSGTANNKKVYVKGIGFIIVGHALHHMEIMKERYL
jgi:hypothetical protein